MCLLTDKRIHESNIDLVADQQRILLQRNRCRPCDRIVPSVPFTMSTAPATTFWRIAGMSYLQVSESHD